MEKPEKAISRRGFLKTSAAVGAVALGAGSASTVALAAGDPGDAAGSEQVFKGCCHLNCQNNCAINIHVREGKVVKTSMRPFPDERYNRICLRGLSHVGRVYSEHRLKYPMKRVGERGSGEWERISWDEALDTIAAKMNEIKGEYGPQAVVLMTGSGNEGLVHGNSGTIVNFMQRFGGTYVARSCDLSVINGMLRTAMPYQNPDAAEWDHCDVFVNWAANLTESNLQAWHFVAENQDRGMKLIVVDSQFSTVASKADLWIHPRQGSDAALGMGVINLLIQNGWYDPDFCLRKTNSPFLVRADTGKILRAADLDPMADEAAGAEALVWDEVAAAPVPVSAAAAPALEGDWRLNGIEVSTVFTLLKNAAADYAPEEVERICDVAPADLEAFASVYGQATNAHVLMGYGTDHYFHGQIPAHAATIMQAITGNLERPGGGIGTYPGYQFSWDASYIAPMYAEPYAFAFSQMAEVMESGQFMGQEFPVKMIINQAGNPVSNYCSQNRWKDVILPKIDLFVAIDITETDTTALADIVLPASHWFETFDLMGKCGAPFLSYQEKAIGNQFESRSDTDIVRALAPRVGVENVWGEDDVELCRAIFEMSSAITSQSPEHTFDNLMEKGFLPYTLQVVMEDFPQFTPSGRYELYLENPTSMVPTDKDLTEFHDALPTYRPQNEVDNAELREKYPLSVNNSHPRWRVHSSYWEVPWLKDMEREPIGFINPADARTRGIEQGDHMRVFNDRGQVVVRAVLSEGIQPGSLDIPKGNQRSQNILGSYNEISTDMYNPINVQQMWFDTLVEAERYEG